MESAENMRQIVKENGGDSNCLRNKVMASVFFEPSTRTSCSFQAAMQRLGGTVISVNEVSALSIQYGSNRPIRLAQVLKRGKFWKTLLLQWQVIVM